MWSNQMGEKGLWYKNYVDIQEKQDIYFEIVNFTNFKDFYSQRGPESFTVVNSSESFWSGIYL